MIRGNVGDPVRPMRTCCATPLLVLAFALPLSAEARSVRIAVVQLKSTETGDFAVMLREARSAKAAGATMIVFPETADIGWLNPKTFSDAAPVPGRVTDSFADIAKNIGIWVVTGLAERGRLLGGQPPTFEVYDSAVFIDPSGAIVLRHRQFNVVRNAFSSCPVGPGGCSYTPGPLSDTQVARTPFGRIGLLVCDDAFTFDTASLDALKPLRPTLVLVPWGVTAGSQGECGTDGFNATGYAAKAAAYLQMSSGPMEPANACMAGFCRRGIVGPAATLRQLARLEASWTKKMRSVCSTSPSSTEFACGSASIRVGVRQRQ